MMPQSQARRREPTVPNGMVRADHFTLRTEGFLGRKAELPQ